MMMDGGYILYDDKVRVDVMASMIIHILGKRNACEHKDIGRLQTRSDSEIFLIGLITGLECRWSLR